MSICCFCFWQKAQTFQEDCSNVIFSSHQKVIIPNSLLLAWKWTSFVLKGRSFIISQRLWQWRFTFFRLITTYLDVENMILIFKILVANQQKHQHWKYLAADPLRSRTMESMAFWIRIYVITISRDSNLYSLIIFRKFLLFTNSSKNLT